MELALGLDIGSVSLKAVVFRPGRGEVPAGFRALTLAEGELLLSPYQRINGQPGKAAADYLEQHLQLFGAIDPQRLYCTGSGGKLVAQMLGVSYLNEFRAVAKGVGRLNPEVRTVFEMGGENSKYIRLAENENGDSDIIDYETNGDCAAGTGSFLDQQASRLRYSVEEIGRVVLGTQKKAQVAGRCSVFAKSDMIHAQQKGYQPAEIVKGLCEAVARNFKGSIAKGKEVHPKVALIGGLAMNEGVGQALREIFALAEEDFFIPAYHVWAAACGCAIVAASAAPSRRTLEMARLGRSNVAQHHAFPASPRLSMDKVVLLRDRVAPPAFRGTPHQPLPVFLGIDIGSVSTNLVLLDERGEVVHEIYIRTEGRPIEVVNNGLQEIAGLFGNRIRVLGVGTTGSGRELIGRLVGADTINDEITAHKCGASFISEKMTGDAVDTIFEIGGQDAKFIRLDHGVVVDFTMNEACAAGTGSFLEEQAEKLGVSIKGEFASLALASAQPIRMGERCTVFMEQDVVACQHKGAEKKDLIAGLAYSVVLNYLNRVVRGRHIGEVIYFQGGTAYNDAVAAAFASVLDKPIIVPPHNGVMGAIGAALLAREQYEAEPRPTTFRGFDIRQVPYKLREFTCQACSNHCDIQEFTVDRERTYWGDKCSDKYRQAVKADRKPVVPDLIGYREKLLWDTPAGGNGKLGIRMGIPRAMYFFERFPFWNRYLRELGFEVLLSEPTNKEIVRHGLEASVAQPCFPIQVAHGHVQDLLGKGVDHIFIPNQLNAETDNHEINSHVCPWGQTLAYVARQAPPFLKYRDLFFMPVIEFRRPEPYLQRQLYEGFKRFGIRRRDSDRAFRLALEAQREFRCKLLQKGREAIRQLRSTGEPGVALVGRPYNIYDQQINLNLPRKLRSDYGVNVLPIDFLPLEGIDIADLNNNMFWSYGKKILQAARLTAEIPNLHLIYITNFKCGPDSYVKQFASDGAVKPFLTLQFDGHGNDAGMMTRVEAYLDSKGVLRWWSQKKSGGAQVEVA